MSLVALVVVFLAVGTVGAAPVGAAELVDATTDRNQQANEPPVASFEFSPTEPEPGQPVVLNASASRDPDGEIATYRWDFDGDNQTDAEGGPNRRIAFPNAGDYPVRLTVVDDDGATDTTSHTITVVGDQSPTARLNVSSTEVLVGETVTMDPTASSDSDGRIVSWAFDTDGDGTFEETFDSPTKLRTGYGEPGTYQITLRVTDNDGLTGTTTATVVVESPTPATPTGGQTAGQATSPGSGPGDGAAAAVPSVDRLPGGGLTIGALLGVLVLLGAGAVLYTRSGARSQGMGLEDSPVVPVVLAVLLVLLLVGVPVYLINRRFVRPVGGSTDLTVALLQLVALALPALLLGLYLLLQFIQHRADQHAPGPVLGPLGAGQAQWLTLAVGFLASVLLTLGLATLLLAGTLPLALTLAAGLVLAGVSFVPLLLAVALVSLSMG